MFVQDLRNRQVPDDRLRTRRPSFIDDRADVYCLEGRDGFVNLRGYLPMVYLVAGGDAEVLHRGYFLHLFTDIVDLVDIQENPLLPISHHRRQERLLVEIRQNPVVFIELKH